MARDRTDFSLAISRIDSNGHSRLLFQNIVRDERLPQNSDRRLQIFFLGVLRIFYVNHNFSWRFIRIGKYQTFEMTTFQPSRVKKVHFNKKKCNFCRLRFCSWIATTILNNNVKRPK